MNRHHLIPEKKIIPLLQTLGVPLRAEIISSKPDAGNAAEGKRIFSYQRSFLKFNKKNQEWK